MHRLGICHVNLFPPFIAMVKVNTPEKFIAKLCNFSIARQLEGNELATSKMNDILNTTSTILFCFTEMCVVGDKLMCVDDDKNVGKLKRMYEKTWKNEVGFLELYDFICLLEKGGCNRSDGNESPFVQEHF